MYVFMDVDKNVGGVFMTFQSTYTLMPLLIYTKFFRNLNLGLAGECNISIVKRRPTVTHSIQKEMVWEVLFYSSFSD